jgi:cysteine desulfurase
LAALCQEKNIFFHTDAAQSVGKIPLNLTQLPVDMLSISAHKIYGPKGIGALFVRRSPELKLQALIHGGGHERGLRSGTLATHQIAGMGEALRIATEEMEQNQRHISALADRLKAGILRLEATRLNGHPTRKFPGIVNISFGYVDGEALLVGLKDFALSSGSACTSASQEPSHVLRAIGLSDQEAEGSIRFSLGRQTTESEVDLLIDRVGTVIDRLRQLSPEWASKR